MSLSLAMPTFLMRAGEAAAAHNDVRILVVVEMSSGNDALNTVIPHADSDYSTMRPNIGAEAYTSSEEIKKAVKQYDVKVGNEAGYPQNNGLGNRLQTVARQISSGVPTRIYYVSIGGFDTHANQPNPHASLLGQMSSAIAAFYRDLGLQGKDKDVLLMTFSEFGRRVKENGSNGTDHGAAGSMFVVGPGVKGGVYGDYPSPSDLDNGDLKFHTDFRGVYSTVLEGGLGAKSQPVLGGEFPRLKFI